jgi:GTPase SAR1 family protein
LLTFPSPTFTLSAELMFLETSARTGENVEETFLKCARKILSKIETGALTLRAEDVIVVLLKCQQCSAF